MSKTYIDRETARAELIINDELYAADIIKAIPAADVAEVRHGQWKSRKNWSRCVCSVCSWESGNEYNYCPNCGAKMTEEET